MLIQLLEIIKNKKTCTLRELAELTGEDEDSIKTKIEYLEKSGYLSKTKNFEVAQCKGKCGGCSNCTVNFDDSWIVKE